MTIKNKLPNLNTLAAILVVIIIAVIGAKLIFSSPASGLPGDANSDGVVNISDLAILGAHYGTKTGATWSIGDFNADGVVNLSDLSILAVHWGDTTGGLSPCTPAAFPSRLRASGRNLVDANGCVMPILKGFNVQVGSNFAWSQANFNNMAAEGAKIIRVPIFWDQFELSQGVVNPSAIANLDTTISDAQKAGLYIEVEVHLNTNQTPSWTLSEVDETHAYADYGKTITQYIANRYGNPLSPEYSSAVLGFGINEPPLEGSILNSNNAIPYLEGVESQMIMWFRGAAPEWIGFVDYAYALSTPIYNSNPSNPVAENPNAIDASPTAYNGVGGNVIIDLHDYSEGITGVNASNPNTDGRQYNGVVFPDYQGGPLVEVNSTSDPTYLSTIASRGQLAAYVSPYEEFSVQAQIPFMIGEWGWVPSSNGYAAWVTDQKTVWSNAGAVIEMYWDYDVTTNMTTNPWSAAPNSIWQPWIADFFSGN